MFWTISNMVDCKCSYFEKIVILVDIDVLSMKI